MSGILVLSKPFPCYLSVTFTSHILKLMLLAIQWHNAVFVCHNMGIFCRRRADFGMLDDPSTDLSDEDLLDFVSDMRSTTHTVGESLVTGSLRSRNPRTQTIPPS